MARKRNANVYEGAVFGSLTVVERLPKDSAGYYRVRARCVCGTETTPVIASLVNGSSRSCGCSVKAALGIGYGKIIPGAKFGRLLVVERLRRGNRYTGKVQCLCDCNMEVVCGIDALLSGNTRSCGCLASEVTSKRNRDTAKWKRFSAKYPKTYSTWNGMISRCYNQNQKAYPRYGGFGVVVCEFLRKSPWNLKKMIGLRNSTKPSIDRYPIHDGNYTCGTCKECKRNGWDLNVRWATRREQSLNRGEFNIYLTAFGRTLTRSEWAELSGIGTECVRKRLDRGWSLEKSLTTPDKFGNCFRPRA